MKNIQNVNDFGFQFFNVPSNDCMLYFNIDIDDDADDDDDDSW